MSPRTTQDMTDWAEHFARAFTELAEGKADVHDLLDWAYELYRTRWNEDPSRVAREEFEASLD